MSQSTGLPAHQRIAQWLTVSFELAFAWICRGVWFALVLWFAVWSYGDKFWPVTWCFYVLFDIWNTFDAISIWHLNQMLIKNDEELQIRTFSQILPLVLISAITFSAVDVFRERLNIRDLQQFQDFVARYEATEMYINQDPNQSMLEG